VSEGIWRLSLRLVLVGLATVVVQITAVSQITVLGATADVVPLAVMSVGLLAGALPGAAFGFGVGLFLDLALFQMLGVSSLIGIGIGYSAGRLRELRDPGNGLLPLAAGAAATAASTIGYSVIQFLLGVDAPVSVLLLRQIVATIVINTLIALPVYTILRRLISGALPDDPARRRRRRAYATGGLSPLSQARPR